MNTSYGFPLYDNVTEVLPKFSEKKISDIIKEAIKEGKPAPDNGDMILKVMSNTGIRSTVVVDKKYCDYLLEESNKSMIIDIIESNHLPTLLEYLSLSGENANVEKYDIYNINKLLECKILKSSWFPEDMRKFLLYKTDDPDEVKDTMIYLTFPDGIKNNKLFMAVAPFISNIIAKSEDDKDPQHGYIEIMLYPCINYEKANSLVSRIFEVI